MCIRTLFAGGDYPPVFLCNNFFIDRKRILMISCDHEE